LWYVPLPHTDIC